MEKVIARAEASLWRACGGQYGPLLVALLTLCLLAPGLTGGLLKGALLDLAMSCIVATGIHAARPRWRSVGIGALLAGATMASHRLIVVFPGWVQHLVHYALMLAILSYAVLTILSAVIRESPVTVETIKGAVCVYLLIGLVWVFVFVIVDLLFPRSFRIDFSPEEEQHGHLLIRRHLPRLLYFSFSTLTTLGYGDIIPVRATAQTACYLEAVVGQIFLTVLVARLVGMHIARAPGDWSAPVALASTDNPAPLAPSDVERPKSSR